MSHTLTIRPCKLNWQMSLTILLSLSWRSFPPKVRKDGKMSRNRVPALNKYDLDIACLEFVTDIAAGNVCSEKHMQTECCQT